MQADQIDTPRVITDAGGKTVWAWDSKPFGETLPGEDPDQDGVALQYNQCFPGQVFDVETGLHYSFHRDYDPATGRYVQSDPVGLDGGIIRLEDVFKPLMNLMREVQNNSDYLQADETRIQVLKEDGKTAPSDSWMWVIRGGPPDKPSVLIMC